MKKYLLSSLSIVILLSCNPSETEKATTDSPASTISATNVTKPLATEIGDEKYVEIGKKQLDNLSSGNVAAWIDGFADNAVYIWNSGDSIVGKAAISTYWTKRRGEVIDSISFLQPIFLPIKVNIPQQPSVAGGTWLLSWYLVESKYKTSGKKMRQWIHTDLHFDSNDKVDRLIQYVDRSIIAAAEKK